jgi:hypothetical protein
MTTPPTSTSDEPLLPSLREWQQALLLSVRLRQAARLLMIIYASAIVASSLPLQLLSSRWYLNAAEVLMANAPIAITAACLRLIAQVIHRLVGDSWQRGRIRFQRFCSLMALLYFMVLPLELFAAGYFAFELHDAERSRLQAASTKPGQRHPPATPHRHHRCPRQRTPSAPDPTPCRTRAAPSNRGEGQGQAICCPMTR